MTGVFLFYFFVTREVHSTQFGPFLVEIFFVPEFQMIKVKSIKVYIFVW